MRSPCFAGLILGALGLACGGSSPPPAAAPAVSHGTRATEARCREVVTRLGQQFPADFPDVESDTRDCLELPAAVVECLAGVKDEAELDGCVRDFCKEQPRSCPRVDAAWTPRPSAEACGRAVDHLMKLRESAAAGSDSRAEIVEACVAAGHVRDVECILAATDLNAVSRCGNDAPRAQ